MLVSSNLTGFSGKVAISPLARKNLNLEQRKKIRTTLKEKYPKYDFRIRIENNGQILAICIDPKSLERKQTIINYKKQVHSNIPLEKLAIGAANNAYEKIKDSTAKSSLLSSI